LPDTLHRRLAPLLARIDDMLAGRGDSALSQRTALVAFSIRIASAAIAYFSQVLMARWMGEFEYGVFVAVWVGFVILGGIACLGFQTAIIRFISEYRTTGDLPHLRGAIRGALGWSFVAASAIAVIGATVLYAVPGLVTGYYAAPVFLAFVCLPMLALQEVQDGVSRAFNWPGTALGPTFLIRPLMLLATMAAATAAGFAADAQTAMAAAIVAAWTASLLQFSALRWRLRRAVPAGVRAYLPRQWLIVAAPIFLVESFYNLLTNVDILIVGAIMPPEKVAVYFATVKTLALAHFVYFAVKAGSAHRFAAYRKSGDRRRYEEFIQETVSWTFWPSLAMAIFMVAAGRYFLMLFGPAFAEGESLIWILAVGIVIRSTVGAAESVLTMSGEQVTCAIAYGSSLFVSIVLNLTLIPVLGLKGAALATTIALLFEAGALYTAARRRLGLHIFILPLGSGMAARPETAK
jgi:O-antigen/teichoic acid export membrane protein